MKWEKLQPKIKLEHKKREMELEISQIMLKCSLKYMNKINAKKCKRLQDR